MLTITGPELSSQEQRQLERQVDNDIDYWLEMKHGDVDVQLSQNDSD